MLLIVPATFGTSPLISVAQRNLPADELTLPASIKGASRLALTLARLLLATAFIVGLVSTIAAST